MTTAIGAHHLSRLADAHLDAVGDAPALWFEGQWFSTGALHARAQRVAGGLRGLGVAPGDRVVVLMMNTPEVFITYDAVWRAGAVVTPVLFLISPTELRHILTHSEARHAVVTHELLPLLLAAADGLDITVVVVGEASQTGEASAGTVPYATLDAAGPLPTTPRGDDDLAALLYTGGTTGRAKGVMLTHLGMWSGGYGLYSARDPETTRALLPLPLSHAFGLLVLIAGMHNHDPYVNVLQRWFDAAGWVRLVEEHRVQTSAVVPSMLTMLLQQPLEEHDLSSLVSFGSGGAPLPMAVRDEVRARLGVEIYEGYGCTEASAGITANKVGAQRPGSVGRAMPGVELAILDLDGHPVPAGSDGEVCARGPGVMQGYWKDAEQTAHALRDGWLHTGDIGRLDEDGYLFIVDRMKDLIIRGGFNVYPRDVEDALLEHPDITQAAVVGRPDAESGEEVVAVVAVRPGATLSGEDIVAWARERLSRYKYPREVRVLDAVPLTSVGKTDRKAVRGLFT
jgi:long-chain acyl-CoA synthetase